MGNVVTQSSSARFKRLFALQCILLGIMLMVFAFAAYQDPEIFPIFLFAMILVIFWFAYFFMMYYLGKRDFIKYSINMLYQYIKIPALFLRQTKNSRLRYFFHIFIFSLFSLILYAIWLHYFIK